MPSGQRSEQTPVNYLDADLKKGKAEQGYLCGYSRPEDNVLFKWRTSRSTAALTDFLEDFKGILQCDAYAAYQKFARGNESVTLVGCMAHVRRKFEQALVDHPRQCALILLLIGKLYEVERHCREHGYGAQETVAYRQKHALNIFKRLHRVIRIALSTALPASTLGKACKYALAQWEHLRHYLENGQVRIDNNLMENAIRPSAIGKKNWLFIGHPQAGERSAIIYSLLASCQRFGHNPRAYLSDVLTRLAQEPDRFHPRDIHALTPKGWNPPRLIKKGI